jgi:hypothetical protein
MTTVTYFPAIFLGFSHVFQAQPALSHQDIRNLVAVRILVGVLQFRIVSRYSSNHVRSCRNVGLGRL